MRLTCPSCDAQYEVADSVIPEEGRDVQCSNCGSTWFQESAAAQAAAARKKAREAAIAPSEGAPVPQPVNGDDQDPDIDIEAAESIADAFGDDDQGGDQNGDQDGDTDEAPADSQDEGDDEDAGSPDEPETGLPQSTVSKSAAQVLQEEALRELKARLSEGTNIESQGDLGMVAPKPKPRKVEPDLEPEVTDSPQDDSESPNATGVSRDAETSNAVADVVGSGSGRLPDIEEINSTLTAASARKAITEDLEDHTAPRPGRRRAGFRIGFFLVLFVALGGLAVYKFAPNLAAQFPDYAPLIGGFVEEVDAVRFWLQAWVGQSVQSLTDTMDAARGSDN